MYQSLTTWHFVQRLVHMQTGFQLHIVNNHQSIQTTTGVTSTIQFSVAKLCPSIDATQQLLHNCDIPWASWLLKSLATQLCVQQLVKLTTKKISKLHTTDLLWGESTTDQWIVMQKEFPCRKNFHVVTSSWNECYGWHLSRTQYSWDHLIMRNKNTLETCKNPRPTSGWSELPKSCTTSTLNFHMAYFSSIPQKNATLKLSCKFAESKCNLYWHITLTTSHEHEDVDQYDPYAIPSEIMTC